MPTLARIRATWSGSGVVGPGVSTMYCDVSDAGGVLAGFRTFFDGVKSVVPSSVQWAFPPAGDTIDELTGKVNGTWTAPSVLPVLGTDNPNWVEGVGARVVWSTIGIVNGRQVRGSTFIVPLGQEAYEGAGAILNTYVAVLQAAASAFASATPTGRIYSRKTALHAGVSFPILAGVAPDKVSWLRSRRT